MSVCACASPAFTGVSGEAVLVPPRRIKQSEQLRLCDGKSIMEPRRGSGGGRGAEAPVAASR